MAEQSEQDPKQAELNDWLQHPVTKRFRGHMRKMQERLKDQWAGRVYVADSAFGVISANATALGGYQQLERLLEISAEELFDEED